MRTRGRKRRRRKKQRKKKKGNRRGCHASPVKKIKHQTLTRCRRDLLLDQLKRKNLQPELQDLHQPNRHQRQRHRQQFVYSLGLQELRWFWWRKGMGERTDPLSLQRAAVCGSGKNKNRKKKKEKTTTKNLFSAPFCSIFKSSSGSILSLTSPAISQQLPAKPFKG